MQLNEFDSETGRSDSSSDGLNTAYNKASLAESFLNTFGIHRLVHVRYRRTAAELLLTNDPLVSVEKKLKLGASAIGLWELSGEALAPLVRSVVGQAIYFPTKSRMESPHSTAPTWDEPADSSVTKDIYLKVLQLIKRFKFDIILVVILTIISSAYGISAGVHSGAVTLLGLPVMTARSCGMAALLWTSVLLLSISRSVLTKLYEMTHIQALLHPKNIHKLAVLNLVGNALVHTIVHCAGTIPNLVKISFQEWNKVIRCAKADFHHVSFIDFPKCPLEGNLTLDSVLKSSVSLTGFALIALLILFGIFSNRRIREWSHRLFRGIHNLLIFAFLFLLYLHGGSQFFGAGVPLVIPVCGLFIVGYLTEKFLEHFTPFKGHIVSATFVSPSVIAVEISIEKKFGCFSVKPGNLSFKEGMFVRLGLQEISRFDLHPFSICCATSSGFKLAIGVRGRWTRKLADRIHKGLPIPVSVAGPYGSPALAMENRKEGEVLIIVASGVGITPFIGSLSGLLERSIEVHLFWVVRHASEILHSRDILENLLKDLKIKMILHVTYKPESTDPSVFFLLETMKNIQKDGNANFDEIKVNLPGSETPTLSVRFGRPDWKEAFSKISTKGTRWVYVCGRSELCKDIAEATSSCSEESGEPFVITSEQY